MPHVLFDGAIEVLNNNYKLIYNSCGCISDCLCDCLCGCTYNCLCDSVCDCLCDCVCGCFDDCLCGHGACECMCCVYYCDCPCGCLYIYNHSVSCYIIYG